MSALSFDAIVAAAHRIRGHIQHTPLKPSARITYLVGGEVLLKMENLHYTGAVKERGTLNKLKCLSLDEQNAGVYAASTGNHALGLAFHAGKLGIRSTLFMPVGTSVQKVTRTQECGAKVVLTGNNYEESLAHCMVAANDEKGTMVHYDDPLIIAGGWWLLCLLIDVDDAHWLLWELGCLRLTRCLSVCLSVCLSETLHNSPITS
jgi:threonine dehydratase